MTEKQKELFRQKFNSKLKKNIDQLLDSEDTEVVNESLADLREQKDEHRQNAYKKHIFIFFVTFLGIMLGLILPKKIDRLNHSNYDRSSLDTIMVNLLGQYNITETISDEVLIVAYDYNSQEPRFFSKYFAHKDPNIYNMKVGFATAASSAAPTFFDPRV